MLIAADELRDGRAPPGAAEMSAAYDDGVVLVAVLKGSVIFLADLVAGTCRSRPTVDFLAISRYAPEHAAGCGS